MLEIAAAEALALPFVLAKLTPIGYAVKVGPLQVKP